MRRVNLFFQEIIKIFAFFLFYFVWIRYFLHSFAYATALSILCSIVSYSTILLFRRKKLGKNNLKLKEKEDAENMFLSLVFSNNPINFFYKLAKKKHPNVTKHKNYIVIEYSLENAKTVLCFDNSFSGLTQEKFVSTYNVIKKENPTKIVICCKDITDKSLFAFCLNFQEKIIIFDLYDTYQKLYKTYQMYPEITRTYRKEKKMAFKDFVAYSFNKKRTKGYLFSAFILVLSGIFVRATLYYCFMSTILLLFALISALNPYFNKVQEDPF